MRSLKVLLISNPHWGIQVVESPMGDTAESTSSRRLVDAGGLIVNDPDLPLFCYLKTRVQGILFNVLCIAVGKFYCTLLFFFCLHKNICLVTSISTVIYL